MHATCLSSKSRRPIHFGIICDGTTFPAWQASCLHKLLALENVEPALLIIANESLTASNCWQKLRDFRQLLWRLYSSFVNRSSKAARPVNMVSTLEQVPAVHCNVIRESEFSFCFGEADIARIQEHDLDFILHFGSGHIRGEILTAARFGVWAFHHGDEKSHLGDPPGFWEVYKRSPITGAILRRLADQADHIIVLRKGYFRTINTSYVRNRDIVYFDSADWPAQVCIDIQNGNADYVDASPSRTSAPTFHTPNNFQVVVFLLRMMGNALYEAYDLLFFYDHWNVGIVNSPIHVFVTPGARPQVQWLPAPAQNIFIADPFAIRRGELVHILFEEYDYGTCKGRISTTSLNGRSSSPSRVVFDGSFHMAYPYLLEHNDQIYCIPETAEAREVGLYAAKQFPEKWEKAATLVRDYAAVDSTVFEYEGRWWLLATDDDDGPNHKLKAWYAPHLLGPWTPHAANPIKVDIRSARPAGTPFMHESHLYRPSQDCSVTYGGRIVLNRVMRLTPTEFEEEQIAVIEPYKDSAYPDGLHTVSAVGDVTIIDGMKRAFAAKSLSVLIHKMSRIRFRLDAFLHRR